ncbi:FAD/NAD-P-binding domain-containing protein [Lactifluus subvellereus]|nr:FAD/NAD-P-binding domain-containing protein [Lactifluus subvellereus]
MSESASAPAAHEQYDCIVVGSGHAGSCAALSAAEHGCARVLLLDKCQCPAAWAGGNGFFTAGAHRTVHAGLRDLLLLVVDSENVPPALAARADVEPYTAEQFADDIVRLSGGRSDAQLVRAVVAGSREAVGWLKRTVGVPFVLAFNRQAYEVDGRQKFWGGMALCTREGGKGLIAAHQAALQRYGVETWFEAPACELICRGGTVVGVVVEKEGRREEVCAPAVVLAAGGYESNAALRKQHLGAGWENARVRGTPYNTGDGISMARAVGARLAGDWASCHATCWDANTPVDRGDRELSNQYTKSGYPLGIMVNTRGARFVDEGADFRNFTYATYGKAILRQPGGLAFQIFDARAARWLRSEEYGDGIVAKIWANSAEELAQRLVPHGLEDVGAFVRTLAEYNQATGTFAVAHPGRKWDPAVKDGVATQGLIPPKSNWALPLEEMPLLAVTVACGITFTFGGLAINPETSSVLEDENGDPIPGLYCTGEMVGGLWYDNYPGGSGLTAGAVFGRIAGREAAKRARGNF